MSFGLGMLRFVEEEVGVRAQCVESVGNESSFPLHGLQHCEIQSSTERGPAVLLKHSSLFFL